MWLGAHHHYHEAPAASKPRTGNTPSTNQFRENDVHHSSMLNSPCTPPPCSMVEGASNPCSAASSAKDPPASKPKLELFAIALKKMCEAARRRHRNVIKVPIFSLGDSCPWRYPVCQALTDTGLRCEVHIIISLYSIRDLSFFSTAVLLRQRNDGQSFFKLFVDLFPLPQASRFSPCE